MVAAVVRLEVCTGLARSVVDPSPSWPKLLRPHAHTVPSDLTASEWNAPPATRLALVSPETWTAVVRSRVVPSPNCP
jgi:hypothetical protein